jgi:tRNA(adenine34) deaminase
VPVGAVVVVDGAVVGRGQNAREALHDPTHHAEIAALREASQTLGRWRLSGATLYVTLEPCFMCAGALVLARTDRVVFATRDAKAGAAGSLASVPTDPRLNHRVDVTEGVLAAEASRMLRDFFAKRRA